MWYLETPKTLYLKRVVDFVTETRAVLVQPHELLRDVHPLPRGEVRIDVDLVPRRLPSLLRPSQHVRQPHAVVEGHDGVLGDVLHGEDALAGGDAESGGAADDVAGLVGVRDKKVTAH